MVSPFCSNESSIAKVGLDVASVIRRHELIEREDPDTLEEVRDATLSRLEFA